MSSSILAKAARLIIDLSSETAEYVVLRQMAYFRPSTPNIQKLDPALSDEAALPILQDSLLRTLFSKWKDLKINVQLLVDVLTWIVALSPTKIDVARAELLCHILNTQLAGVLADMFKKTVLSTEFVGETVAMRSFEANIGLNVSDWLEKCKRNPTIVETILATLNELKCTLTAEGVVSIPIEMFRCKDTQLLGYTGRHCVYINTAALDFEWSLYLESCSSVSIVLKQAYKVDLAALVLHELTHVALCKACSDFNILTKDYMHSDDIRQEESGRLSELRLFGGQARNFSASVLVGLDNIWVNRFVAAVDTGCPLPDYSESVNAILADQILSAGMIRKARPRRFY